ncbi:carbohydrate ABC transporter permease [Paenibacillus lutrae]|uniref:ABC transporter permease subunit n=1 Tax=Paenibacillus lutrae TaxID=2078573 RepID=A0A7X3JXC7_9BACL|nr:sugar ABC transporter permease [Paenibacillus lutrae]MVO97983.1 ABC transporter permease subunit [Paenibacillus lutrae]
MTGKISVWKDNGFAWLLLLPSLIFLFLFTFYPMVKTLYLSFHQADLATPDPLYTGLDNYMNLAEDAVFRKVLLNNVWFALGTVPSAIGMALLMALFANKALKAKGWIRTAFFYPNMIPMIAAASVWLFIYTPQYGLLSRLAGWLGQGTDVHLLGSQDTVMWAMIVMIVWKEAGYLMIFYLAGLQNIPKDLFESAAIDGVGRWTVFRKITFPLLMPTTLFVMIVALTNSFKLVDHLFIMTKGGPDNASSLLLYYIYESAFSFWDQGAASAMTMVMIALLMALAALQYFGLDKHIHYR